MKSLRGSRKSAEARTKINTNIATPLQNCKCNDTAKIGYDQESAEALVEYDVDDRNCEPESDRATRETELTTGKDPDGGALTAVPQMTE